MQFTDIEKYNRKQYAVFLQNRILKLPVPNSLHLWTITCNVKTVNCTSMNCPFWQHSSTSGRLLVSSVLRLSYNEMGKRYKDCKHTEHTKSKYLITLSESESESVQLKFRFVGNHYGGTNERWCIN